MKTIVKNFVEQDIYDRLVESFNKASDKLKSKYKIIYVDNHPKLIRKGLFGLGTGIPPYTISYDIKEKQYFFIGGILEDDFRAIQPIIDEIKDKHYVFLIEVVK